MGAAVGFGDFHFSVRAHGSNDGGAQGLGPLRCDEANAAGGGVEQNCFAGLHLVGGAQEIAHGHAFQHHAGGGLVAYGWLEF